MVPFRSGRPGVSTVLPRGVSSGLFVSGQLSAKVPSLTCRSSHIPFFLSSYSTFLSRPQLNNGLLRSKLGSSSSFDSSSHLKPPRLQCRWMCETPSPVSVYDALSERGLVNQTIGSKAEFDALLTRNPNLGIYAGIDPTASSLHIGHLLPFMALIRCCLLGYPVVALVGSGTARIGDPTGRKDARIPMTKEVTDANAKALATQLHSMYENAQALASRSVSAAEVGTSSRLKKGRDPSSESQPESQQQQQQQQQQQLHQPLIGPNGPGEFTVLENHVWMEDLSVLAALAELGPAFRIGPMLGRDTVKTRLENGAGMALSEFMYPFLQALDWVRLFHLRGVGMQIGGSDQFGNILAGANALKYVFLTSIQEEGAVSHDASLTAADSNLDTASAKKSAPTPVFEHICKGPVPISPSQFPQPLGLTVPLLKTPSGEKFGKSAGNAVWLDHQLTSPFELYAYFMATPDNQLDQLFRLFTFLPLSEIETLLSAYSGGGGHLLEARHRLATEVTALVHGIEVAERTRAAHRALFGRGSKENGDRLTVGLLRHLTQSLHTHPAAPSIATEPSSPGQTRNAIVVTLRKSDVFGSAASKTFQLAGLVDSASEGRKLISMGGAYIGVASNRHSHHSGQHSLATMTEDDRHDVIEFQNVKNANEPLDRAIPSPQQKMGGGTDVLTEAGATADSPQKGHFLFEIHPEPSETQPDRSQVMILRSGKRKIKVVRLVD